MANIIRRPNDSLGLSAFGEFDKLFDDIWQGPSGLSRVFRTPSLDIYSTDDDHMVVEMQTPGFNEKDIDISVRNGVLEVRAETSSSEQSDKKRHYVMRESHTSFARRVVLPEGADADSVSAELDDGILKITVPVSRPDAKKIEISAGSHDKAKK